jgi:uncharacterized membrane protein YdcZ (DUF606 family)
MGTSLLIFRVIEQLRTHNFYFGSSKREVWFWVGGIVGQFEVGRYLSCTCLAE